MNGQLKFLNLPNFTPVNIKNKFMKKIPSFKKMKGIQYTIIDKETRSVEADLKTHPCDDEIRQSAAGLQLAIGDLHGNSIKFLYFLIREGVLALTPEIDKTKEQLYEELVAIYEKNLKCTEQDIQRFYNIIENATIKDVGAIKIIGDELCDRGKNDGFTFPLLKKLYDNNVDYEILFSNHSAEFIFDFRLNHTNFEFKSSLLDSFGQSNSYKNLGYLIKKGIISEDEVRKIYDEAYLPKLKLISYSLNTETNPPSITLFTHAPVGLESIEAAAKYYKIKYNDNSTDCLMQTIDKINAAFQKQIKENPEEIQKQFFPYNYTKNIKPSSSWDKNIPPKKYPLWRFAWNRPSNSKDIQLPIVKNGYQINLVHGHDGGGKRIRDNMTNLDNDFGKGNLEPGNYSIHVSNDKSCAMLQKTLLEENEIEVKINTTSPELITKLNDSVEILKRESESEVDSKLKAECFNNLKKVARDQNAVTLTKLEQTAHKVRRCPWGKILAASLFAVIGAAIVVASVAAIAGTFGFVSPIAVGGIVLGTTVTAKSCSIIAALGGVGVFSGSIVVAKNAFNQTSDISSSQLQSCKGSLN